MRTLNVSSLVMAALAVTFLSHAQPLYAQVPAQKPAQNQVVGGVGSGGGDECDRVIQVIRDNFINWINTADLTTLELPKNFSKADYVEKMRNSFLTVKKIKCVAEGDEGYPVLYNGTPKTCRFDFDRARNFTEITCDIIKLLRITDENGRYRMYHHEHAGLIGLEPMNEDESSFQVTNQVTAYLGYEKRLMVKPQIKEELFLTYQKTEFINSGRVVRTLISNTLFKGTILESAGVRYARIEQMFNGISWEKVTPGAISLDKVRVLQKITVKLWEQENPVFNEFISKSRIDNFPANTRLRGWLVNTVFGDYIFAEEIEKPKGFLGLMDKTPVFSGLEWVRLEQPGFVKINRP